MVTKEEITRMARQAGWDDHHCQFDTRIERFAALVAAAESQKKDAALKLALEALERIKPQYRYDGEDMVIAAIKGVLK